MSKNVKFNPTNRTDIRVPKARQAHKALGREDRFLAHMHCTHNPFIRHVLKLRQYGRCPACGKLISPESQANVHHLSYLRYCGSRTSEIKCFFPRDNGMIYAMTPNCELCYYDCPEKAEAYLNNLVLLHSDCHDKLHKIHCDY